MFVIGTAGHVDHGKSTLVKALSGINPDRLEEEQEREMSIDLGFAWLELPSGREVSIVDVPGHEDFIKNMLAGVGGIDMALLVVAADEAVMPQTREHLAILDLLELSHGVVALTKADLVEDPEWLELVQEEVRELLQETVMAEAPIVPVSALTGRGLPELLDTLDDVLDQTAPRADVGQPRLPVDRVFSISGFGTVVTGTLVGGMLHTGDEVEIVPGGLSARIRGLQTHKTKVDEAVPGSRVAANLSGVGVDQVERGQVLTRAGLLRPTRLVDARLRMVRSAPWPLKHNALVELFSGATRVEAHIRLLDAEILQAGQEGWVQYRLAEPIAVMRDDHYILRLPSPSITVGGGRIVQPHPPRRHRRFRPEVIERLEALHGGDPEDVLVQLLARNAVRPVADLARESGLAAEVVLEALERLIDAGRVAYLSAGAHEHPTSTRSGGLLLVPATLNHYAERARAVLVPYHEREPLRFGMPREELRSRLRLGADAADLILDHLAREGDLRASATVVALPDHEVTLTPQQQAAVDRALRAFADEPSKPPTLPQVEEMIGSALTQYLIDAGRLIKLTDDVLFETDIFAEMEQRLVDYMETHEQVTVSEVRDLFDTSRRYALSFLEDLDRRRVTKRLGDVRVLR